MAELLHKVWESSVLWLVLSLHWSPVVPKLLLLCCRWSQSVFELLYVIYIYYMKNVLT